jgi:hypothetical protein
VEDDGPGADVRCVSIAHRNVCRVVSQGKLPTVAASFNREFLKRSMSFLNVSLFV